MATKSPRKFTIADVMILVAAAAVGSLFLRVYHAYKNPTYSRLPFPLVWRCGMEISPILIVCPFALLVARAISPRPAIRRVFRQPGTVACLAVSFGIISHEISLIIKISTLSIGFAVENHFGVTYGSGYSVALAWMVMALLGAWRPEASWVDRSGRVLGWFLIVLWVLISFNL